MNHFLQLHELQQELQKKNIAKQSIQISKIIKKIIKKKVPEDKSTRSWHPYQPRSIIRWEVFVAPLPASRCTFFLTIPIYFFSKKYTVMNEDMGCGSLKRLCFLTFQFLFLLFPNLLVTDVRYASKHFFSFSFLYFDIFFSFKIIM